jgi:hypothetical protein
MGPPRGVRAFVARLEDRISEAIDGHQHVALSYSGGLASTLVAMVARKRCELNCFVAGTADSPDVKEAMAAKTYFDYRIEHVPLNRTETHRVLAAVEMLDPQLRGTRRAGLIPLCAVIERATDGVVLCGYGGSRLGPDLVRALERAEVRVPLHDLLHGRAASRHLLQSAAIFLGLPVAWARKVHRNPETGAGIVRFLPVKRREATAESDARS